ncbi:hypothetical protein D3C83_191330 [compost metagenome]
MSRHPLDQPEKGRRFPGADLARDHGKAFPMLHPVLEMRQGFVVASAGKDETGVGRQRKRVFRKSKKLLVHVPSGG